MCLSALDHEHEMNAVTQDLLLRKMPCAWDSMLCAHHLWISLLHVKSNGATYLGYLEPELVPPLAAPQVGASAACFSAHTQEPFLSPTPQYEPHCRCLGGLGSGTCTLHTELGGSLCIFKGLHSSVNIPKPLGAYHWIENKNITV